MSPSLAEGKACPSAQQGARSLLEALGGTRTWGLTPQHVCAGTTTELASPAVLEAAPGRGKAILAYAPG